MSSSGAPSRPYFFISRAGEDKEWAVWIAEVLQESGHDFFIQDHDIRFGDSFVVKMREAMEKTDHVICVLTPEYLAKDFTKSEMDTAYSLDPNGQRRMMLIVRVKPCEVPKLYSQFVYLDLRERSDSAKRRLLAMVNGEKPSRKGDYRTFISSLPTVDPTLIGRDDQLAFLDRAWADPEANFVQIVAAGGTGKTALVDKWFRKRLKEATTFGWSFYSQGTSENRQTSSDQLFAEILPFFNISIDPTASIYAKAEAVARRLREEQVLLILDGVEPLQDSSGALRDQLLAALLHELAARNKGLVVCTTRFRITDVPDDDPRSLSIDLDNLLPDDGARYLRHLDVQGTDDEIREASADYDNHALALTLLGTYLADFCDHDVRRRVEIPKLMVDDVKAGAHARRVMDSYARVFEGKPELDVLRALGYFDRPAEPEAVRLVLPGMPDRTYRGALNRLKAARLILSADPASDLDCHPLIREHFGEVLQAGAPDEFRAGHSRLYEHYAGQAPMLPGTPKEMTLLFYAVYHGCRAGRYDEALNYIYKARIQREEFYLTKGLGAFGTDLSLLANFFTTPWTVPVPDLSSADDRNWVINVAAFNLRALGRLADAAAPMKAGAQADVDRPNLQNAAISYTNLSELQLAIGNLPEAVVAARKAVELADRSGNESYGTVARTAVADALHQQGSVAEARRLYEEAESLQQHYDPHRQLLFSQRGYHYCDLLLSEGMNEEVLRRATETIGWVTNPLSVGLDHLSLGRAYPAGSAESVSHLDQAVEYLRTAGTLHHLPRALLARGRPDDLDAVYTIAARSGMRLHLTDYHLAQARLDLREGRVEKARTHAEQAAKLIEETGYHRRDAELAELQQQLAVNPT